MWDTFHFMGKCPCQQLIKSCTCGNDPPLLIFDFWGHMRTLCLPTGHPWRNTPIYVNITPSRVVSALFWSLETLVTTQKYMCVHTRVCSHTVSSHAWNSCLRRVFWRQIPLVTLANELTQCLRREIKPPCIGIGQKLISVDQNGPTTMVMITFSTLWLRILRTWI